MIAGYETFLIGPNRCVSCGGEYGQHDKNCPDKPKKRKKRKIKRGPHKEESKP